MTDFSVGKTSQQRSVAHIEQIGDYQKLKNEYEKFLKKAEKSDLANSPTLNQKKLEMLKQLREQALKESNYTDFDMIEEEINLLSSIIEQDAKKTEDINTPYVLPLPKKNSLISFFEACKNANGEIDNETRKIVLAFKDMDVTPRNLSKFVDKCRGLGDVIPKETLSAVLKLADAKISPNVIFQALDDSAHVIDDGVEKKDFSWVDDVILYSSMGIDDAEALKFSKKLNKNFENKKEVNTSIVKMLDAGFSPDMASSLVLSFSKTEDGVSRLNTKSINSLLTMKKHLASSRTNERNERQNPINKLNQVTFYMDDTVIIMKDNKVVEYIKKTDESYNSVKKDYDDFASEFENKIIQNFAEQYKIADNELDSSALRVFSSLRTAGVSYEQMLPLVNASLEKVLDSETGKPSFDIKEDVVNSMIALKKAGALSSDLSIILDAVSNKEDGSIDKEDVKNACTLTKMIIAGKDVASLLSEVKNSDEMMSFVDDFSKMMTQKENILPLVQLIKKSDGNYDDNAAEAIYSLAEHFLYTENMVLKEQDYLKLCEDVIASSKLPSGEKVDENSSTVVVGLCRVKEAKENILKALQLCKDEYGYPNESLADIIWDMSQQKANFTDIIDLINICKPVSGILDIERASLIADLLDNKCSVDEIMSFARNLGHN